MGMAHCDTGGECMRCVCVPFSSFCFATVWMRFLSYDRFYVNKSQQYRGAKS